MRKLGLAALSLCLMGCGGEERIRRTLKKSSGVVELPAGVVEVSSELVVPEGAKDLEIRGAASGTVLRAADGFKGRAVLVVAKAANVRFRNFEIEGNRAVLEKRTGLPPSDVPFAKFTTGNGILADRVERLTISGVKFRDVAGFAVLVARSNEVAIERVRIEDSGSRNSKGRNNTTGGILLEEGTSDFRVTGCALKNVRGNGIWTHSLYTSPRNRGGVIGGNRFETIGRDAIQVGHATNVTVGNNTGTRIGYPNEEVDVENGGIPVAIDTAGNVDRSIYAKNRFEEINGKCIDLDGFHHGEVRDNTCINRGSAGEYPFGHYGIVFNNSNPDMQSENVVILGNQIDGTKYGGIFVIGSGHRITGNRLRNINTARCNESGVKFNCLYFSEEPKMLQTGIYLGKKAERPAPARGNVVNNNSISGWKMSSRCIAAAPGVSLAKNKIGKNRCFDER